VIGANQAAVRIVAFIAWEHHLHAFTEYAVCGTGCKKHATMKVTQYKTGKASLYAQVSMLFFQQHMIESLPDVGR